MHLIFGAPRFICSREFRHLYLKAETRQAKTTEKLISENDPCARIVEKSQAEHYVTRDSWALPSDATLQKRHPFTGEVLWRMILRRSGSPGTASATLISHKEEVERRWPLFLELLSWWECKRAFNRSANIVALNPKPDIVVLHPAGGFAQARTDEQWRDACFWTLMAHCNHGDACTEKTFRDADHLKTFSHDAIFDLTARFVNAPAAERVALRLAPCPPHVAKAWHLGTARWKAAEAKLRSTARVAKSVSQNKYVVVEHPAGWQQSAWDDMSETDKPDALDAWRQAEFRPSTASAGTANVPRAAGAEADIRPGTASADPVDEAVILQAEEDDEIDKAIVIFMQKL